MLIAFLYGDLGKNTGHKRCSCYINLKDDVGVRNFSLYISKAPEFMVSKGDKSPIPPHPHFPSKEAPPSAFSLILGCVPSLLCRDFDGQARTYGYSLSMMARGQHAEQTGLTLLLGEVRVRRGRVRLQTFSKLRRWDMQKSQCLLQFGAVALFCVFSVSTSSNPLGSAIEVFK